MTPYQALSPLAGGRLRLVLTVNRAADKELIPKARYDYMGTNTFRPIGPVGPAHDARSASTQISSITLMRPTALRNACGAVLRCSKRFCATITPVFEGSRRPCAYAHRDLEILRP